MIEILSENSVLLIILTFIFGLMIGSFLNVVIHRLPILLNREWRATATEILVEAKCEVSCPKDRLPPKYNLISPRSECPTCLNQLGAVENIPVLSWLVLRGKCRHCKTSISIRYPFVELLTGLLFALCAYHFGFEWPLFFALIFTAYLVSSSFIDYDHKILPDQLTLQLIWFGLLAIVMISSDGSAPSYAPDLQSSVLGALAGYLSLWSIYWLFKFMTGKEGMGHGDFKLLAAIGAFVGYQLLPLVIILSSVSGVLLGVIMIVFHSKGRDFKIPFGPFLAIAGWITLLWGELIISNYLQLFNL